MSSTTPPDRTSRAAGRPPAERFALAERSIVAVDSTSEAVVVPRQHGPQSPAGRPVGVSRWVNSRGRISLAGFEYAAGATFAGEQVEVVASGGLVDIFHAGVLVATHAQRLKPDQADRIGRRALVPARARDATTGMTVTRLADGSGTVSFAGAAYSCGRRWARHSFEVSIVAGSVQLASAGTIIPLHPIRHDRTRELGAFANPNGRNRRSTTVA